MTRDQRLHGTAVYNPDLLSKEELIEIFVARMPQLNRLLDGLRAETEGPPQHHLISGRRGMGKTTLLRRLRYAIEDDPELSQVWLGLNFPEEQYNVANLSDFWLNCVDALADTLEASKQDALLPEIDAAVESLQGLVDEEERRSDSLKLLMNLSDRLGRRFVLCVDNVDLVLDRLKTQDWALREVLSSEQRLVLIGASSAGLEHTYKYEAAFYDFFRLHVLKGLDDDETFSVMRRLAQAGGHPQVEALLDNEPARIKTIRLLAGGNPRTIVLLFNLLAQGVEGDVRTDLERLLDQCTPLYKHRFEDLPELSQRVVDALALHWHPMTAGELAKTLRFDVNKASAQLSRLVKLGVVEKVDMKATRLGFQIAERFFNIWYLMRASRRVRNRLTFLVEFLRMMFAPRELAARSRRYLVEGGRPDRMRHAEFGMALSYVVDDCAIRDALRMTSAQTLAQDPATRAQLGEIFDFEGEHREFLDTAQRIQTMSAVKETVFAAERPEDDWDPAHFWALLGGDLSLSPTRKQQVAAALPTLHQGRFSEAVPILEGVVERQTPYGAPLHGVVRQAVAAGFLDAQFVLSDARASAAKFDAPHILAFACAWRSTKDEAIDFSEFSRASRQSTSVFVLLEWAKQAVEEGVEAAAICSHLGLGERGIEGTCAQWNQLGNLLNRQSCLAEAVVAFRAAIEQDAMSPHPWNGLAATLQDLGNLVEAEEAYRQALALDEKYAFALQNLGGLLRSQGRLTEAKSAYQEAIALDANCTSALTGLGNVLAASSRYGEAEAAFRKALSVDVKSAAAWNAFGNVLARLGRYVEAEAAFREAIAVDEALSYPWKGLGDLLHGLRRYDEAEAAYRKAVENDPNDWNAQNGLAWFLYANNLDGSEAEAHARLAVERDPGPYPAHTLACILVRNQQWADAEPFARQFIAADEAYHAETWSESLMFFAEAVKQGYPREARELLAYVHKTDRWQPLVLALGVAEAGSIDLLRRVAPEMRQAAELVLEAIAPDFLKLPSD